MNGGDDDLERRLRAMFRAHQLNIADDDLLGRVHAGARRRQHRRVAASGAAVVAVVAIAGTAFALRPHPGPAVTADNHHPVTSTAPPPSSAAPPSSASPSPSFAGKPPVPSTLLPSPSASEPAKFNPVSVSAVSVDDYWVLGYVGGGAVIMHTTDGGQHFDRTGSPPVLVAQAPIRRPAGSPTISDIRFGDARHGWAYGKSLYETDDAGATWKRTTTIPGGVVDLAALGGSVWAVVEGTTSNGNASTFAIYQATFSADGPTGTWREVRLPVKPDQPPSIAVQGSKAYVLAASGSDDRLLTLTTDGKVGSTAAPCTYGLPGYVSAGATPGAFWATCVTGMMASIFVSPDAGKTWSQVPAEGSNGIEVGAVSATTAMLADNVGDAIAMMHADGRKSAIAVPDLSAGADFIGFTTSKVGFVLARSTNTTALWRTTDGGTSWSVVSLPVTSG